MSIVIRYFDRAARGIQRHVIIEKPHSMSYINFVVIKGLRRFVEESICVRLQN